MTSNAKTLIQNKEWLIQQDAKKIGSVAKSKKGYVLIRQGKTLPFKDLAEINAHLGVSIIDDSGKKIKKDSIDTLSIYDFPCSSKPHQPVFNVRKKLPLFAKSDKSKSQYCAGYYTIKFRKGWVKSFCPKLITLERYPFHGPYKTEVEMKNMLNMLNKNETIT